MTTSIAIAAMLCLTAFLVWAGMTGRLEPANRTARRTLNVALALGAVTAGVIALAWLVLISSFVF